MPGSEQLDVESRQHLIYLRSLSIFPRSERLALIEEWLQEEEFAEPRNSILRYLGLGHAMAPGDLLSGTEMKLHSASGGPITVDDHLNYLFSLRIFDNTWDEDWARLRKEGCIQAWLNFVGLALYGRKTEEGVKKALGLDELNSESIGRILQEAAEKGLSWRHEPREEGARRNRTPRFLGGRKTNKSREIQYA